MPSAEQRNATQFKVHGLDCAEEVGVLKRELGPLVGGEDRLSFDILNGRMQVETDVSAETILRAVAVTGMRAEVVRGDARADETDRVDHATRRARIRTTAISGASAAAGLTAHAVHAGGLWGALEASERVGGTPLLAIGFYVVAVAAGVVHVLPKAWHALTRARADMNLLMTLAVAGAMVIGQWFEAATVAFLFSLSLALEAWSVGRARRAVAALLELAPATVRVVRANGLEQSVPAEDVEIGETFVVKPGERIPLDGRVSRGATEVNQAPITGESAPVAKSPGDDVFAGTINGQGAVEIESLKRADDTTLARIIQMVGQAQSRRAPSEQWVERFARVYTPAVLALALAAFVAPPLLDLRAWGESFYSALVLLVIACPCALVISTPVSIVAALACAARQGVLIKGGLHVETPAGLRAIAFDKTGTLTVGRLSVVAVVPLSGHDERELLARAAALEARSEHPIGRAVIERAKAAGAVVEPASDVRAIAGKGVTGRINGRTFWLGSHRYLEETREETPEVHQALVDLAREGRSVVAVGNEDHVCGLIALADAVRPEARAALAELRSLGVDHLAMVTGDNRQTAESIAGQTGIDRVHAELLPPEKVTTIEALVAQYDQVAMVGDGVNDAPALARASLGIAMGAVGSDAAIETADVALMSDDLSRLPWLIRHSRRTLAIIRQNITASLVVKAAFVALTLAGHASLWAAIAADTGATLAVIFNGLRLLRASK
jgi:Cd2+/Zn2+-exporting ATPase